MPGAFKACGSVDRYDTGRRAWAAAGPGNDASASRPRDARHEDQQVTDRAAPLFGLTGGTRWAVQRSSTGGLTVPAATAERAIEDFETERKTESSEYSVYTVMCERCVSRELQSCV